MAPYYILISIVAAVSYFIIKKYLPFKGAIAISLLGFVLTAIFPLMITRISPLVIVIIYIIIGLLASVVVKRMEITDSKHNSPVAVQEFETAVTTESDLEVQQQVEPLTMEGLEEPNNEEDDIHTQDGFVIEEEREAEFLELPEIKPELYPQLPEDLVTDLEEEEISFSEDIPDSYSYAGITRSIIVEPEAETETELEAQVKDVEEIIVAEPDNADKEDVEIESQPNDSEADLVEETEIDTTPVTDTTTFIEPVPEILTAKQLISNGLSQSRLGNYNDAVKMLMEALKKQPEPELKYLAVSEISTIYQHIGFYQLAVSILAAYIKQRDLQDHPGIKTWQEKLEYLNNMINLLKENKLPSLPYNEVPDFIKKKAFSMILEKTNN